MDFTLADMARKDRYKLIAGAIVPRPVALVTSLNADGSCNAAPFSAFNYMSEDPPLVALGLQVHPDGHPRAGEPKDTTRNIEARHEFVVNVVDEDLLDAMVACAADFPPGESEPERLGLELSPSRHITVPRLRRAPIALECRRHVTLNFGSFRTIAIGEVIGMYFRDDLIDPARLHVDLDRYRPVGRLTGDLYCRTQDRLARPIPKYGT